MRRQALWSIVGWCVTLVAALVPLARAEQAGEAVGPPPMVSDAQIADLCFVDAKHGWAVGDRGTIWQTADGGQHWKLQSSGVECRLASVFFLDAKIGWAAGGYTQPYTHASSGVVLRTRDGGEHWTVERKLILPAVARIGFFDPQHGWALGQPSALFPSGAFATEDGGRAWSALPSAESRGWLTGDFIDPNDGALAGRAGRLATVRRRSVEPVSADFGLRALHRMQLVAPAGGWLVGDGGLVMTTRDLGKSWQTTSDEIPAAIRDHFDFEALAVRGRHCWVAGTPGTRLLHSADGGQTWTVSDTGQSLPVHALAFADDRNGWAAGDFGTILNTSDGGRSWQPQRGGGTRAALLGCYGRPDEIPLELVARLSADEGYLAAIEILGRDDVLVRAAGADDPALQAHEASVQAGASAGRSAWRFPLRQAGLNLSAEQLVADWNRANDTRAIERLESYVVARIRMWRPSVVFTTTADSQTVDPLAYVVNQIVLRAVEAAADPSRHVEQISEAGLRPWQVQKVFGSLAGSGANGAANLDTAQLSARYGRSMGELAVPARALIDRQYVAPPATLGFRLLVDHIPQEVGRRDFFSGITLAPGGEARRMLEQVADSDLETLHRQAQRRRNLQAILAKTETNDPSDGRFLADIGEQTRSMQPERAAEVLWQLAARYYRSGRWEMACECYALVADRYPNHPLAPVALAWLVQYHASGEAAWRGRAASGIDARQFATQAPARRKPPADKGAGGVRRAAAIGGDAVVERAGGTADNLRGAGDERFAKADNYAKQLAALQPALMAEPAVRFPLAVAQRQQGLPRQSERYFLGLRHSRPHDSWWACAQGELWLAEPKDESPKQLWNCSPARDKPKLDGRLDEPMWRAGNVVELRSPSGDDEAWPADAMLAYDDEFLYVGVRCTRAEGFHYEKSTAPRPRDPRLLDQDRVELLIDIDRDFVTYYRLTIDHRGWTGEACWGDQSWDPGWFVASGETDGAWTAEAAIPLAELAAEPPVAGRAWAVGMQRVVPGVGFQAWTAPASTEILPEGFGYLIFR